MKRYEYKCVAEEGATSFEKALNVLANNGYKVIFSAVFPGAKVRETGTTLAYIATLEREVPETALPELASPEYEMYCQLCEKRFPGDLDDHFRQMHSGLRPL